jgi:hypothetical protein
MVNHRAPQDPSCEREQRDHDGSQHKDATATRNRPCLGRCWRSLGDQA